MSAASTAATQATIGKLVRDYMTRTHTPGAAIALHADGQDRFLNFGYADLATQQPVTEETVFEIGSVTKVFTATLLADQLTNPYGPAPPKKLSDPVSTYLPPSVTNPQLRAITLQELATHTAGFPDEGGGPGASDNLFADQPPSANLVAFWNGWAPADEENLYCRQCRVGTCWQYSNVGFVTLGFAVVGQPGPPQTPGYNDLLARTITGPLGMPATVTHVPPGTPIAQGYRGVRPAPVAGQAADLKSSARDMLAWLKANLGTPGSVVPQALAGALALTHQTFFTSTQQCAQADHPIPFDMGLAWQKHPLRPNGPTVLAKDGATGLGGFSCWIGFVPDQALGLAVLTNHIGLGGPTPLGLAILNALAS